MHTEDPYWLEEAYTSQAINNSDTGCMQRNIGLSKRITAIIRTFFNVQGCFLDYAGGYGILVRLMRDIGFDFYYQDPYAQNLFAKGFEYQPQMHKNIELVTTVESFEHFENPLVELEKILAISKNIFFTTLLLPFQSECKVDAIPHPTAWWYYGLDHGQHISFYSYQTLAFIAAQYQLNFYSNKRDLHLFTKRKINPLFFKIVCRLSVHNFFFWLFKRNLLSKTQADMDLLKATYFF